MIKILTNVLSPVLLPMGVSAADLEFYLETAKEYIFMILCALLIMIVVLIAAVKVKKGFKLLVRGEAVLAFLLVVLICANQVCYGPLYNTLNSYMNASTVELADDVVEQSLETIDKIGEEGIVLLENKNDYLPLSSDTTKLNVFGWASVSPLLGGTGSSASNAAASTDILTSLEDAGYHVNQTLVDMYTDYCAERPNVDMNGQDLTLPEPTKEYYTDEIMEEAKEFSDTALIVLGRQGGEDFDLPQDMNAVIHGTYNNAKDYSVLPDNYTYLNCTYTNNGDYDDFDEGESYLELTNTEEDMIQLVCEAFDHVVVVVNACNTMELGWVESYDSIDAVLLAPAPGTSGFKAFGEILNGTVNPSGKTTDTFVRDLLNTPTSNNTGNFSYTNVDDMKEAVAKNDSTYEGSASFVNYVEGIYVGYKFYETAAEEGLIEYDSEVQYPFGYGLSYTTFEKTIENFKSSGDTVTFDVTVKNTGEVAGKDVVEIYYTPPYENGGIEKASVNLIDFEKTELIEPGETKTVSFEINKEDMASYDSEEIKVSEGGYILEAGEYVISVRSDSHTVLAEERFTVSEDIDYSKEGRSSDNTAAVNQFEDYSRGDFVQLSRADGFANYEEAVAAPDDLEMDDNTRSEVEAQLVGNYDGSQYDTQSDEMPTMGEDNGLKLADFVGVDYDDDKWEQLLDELSFDDMATLINVGGWQTAEVSSIEKAATQDCDGPAGLNNFMTGSYGTTYPAEILIGQTWSKDMAVEVGASMGSEFAAANNYGWYGPAMNLHRSAFAGRNFEYFSEDGVLSGYMASGETQGAAQFGVYSYIKHLVLNDQETNRCGVLLTYASEQTIRENYLRPFEMTVKNFQGKSMAVMASYNWIGTKPCCANSNLLNQVLREEWGFVGMVESDYDGSYGYMITENSIRNGVDLMLGFGSYSSNELRKDSATLAQEMRQSCKNILYTVVNSGYYSDGTPIITENKMDILFNTVNRYAAIGIAVLEILLLAAVTLGLRKKKRMQKNS